MRNTTTLKRHLILTAAVLAAMSSTHARAATLFWDADGSGSAATGGTGNWTDPNTWRSGSATGGITNWVDGSDAMLPNTSGTITIGGTPVAANSLTFANTAGVYDISGAGTLTVPTITMTSNVAQRIGATLNGAVTVVNNNPGAGANGATILALAGTPTITTLTFGAGGSSFDKNNRIDFEATTTSNVTAFNYTNIQNINFDNNFGLLSATLPSNTGAEVQVNAAMHSNVAGGYAMLASAGGVRFHFLGAIDGPGGIAIVSAPATGTARASNGAAGVGAIVLNNSNNTYAGPTRIMSAPAGILRSQVDNFLPKTTDLVFGGNGLLSVGFVNLNGMDLQIGSLSTEAGVTTPGIANTGSQAIAEVQLGIAPPNHQDGADAIVTINGSNNAAFQNTTFAGAIGTNAGGGVDRIGLVFAGPSVNGPGHTGTLTMTNGASPYAMGTTINSGVVTSRNTLNNFATSPVGVGAVVVNGTSSSQHGTFGGSGQVIGAVAANDFSHIAPGGVNAVDPSNPLTLNAGLTLAGGSSVDFEFNGFGGDTMNTTSLDVSTTTNVNLNLLDLGSGIHNGTFRLIDYDSFTGDFSKFNLVKPAGSSATFTLQQNTSDNAVDVLISGAAGVITWSGDNGPAWDVNSTVNWKGPAPTKFFNGDFVTFDDSASGFNVNVAGGGVSPATVTVNAGSEYTFNGGAISASTLTKSNFGTLHINNATTFSLGTTVTGGGTLAIGATGSISGGAISVTDSILAVSAAANISGVPSVSLNNSILRADGSFVTNRTFALSGPLATVDTNGNALELSGAFTGTTKLVKSGAGTLKISSTAGSGYSGAVDVDAGTMAISGVDANGITGLGSTGGPAAATSLIVKNGATLDLQNVKVGLTQSSGAVNASAGLNLILKTGSTLMFSGESAHGVGAGSRGVSFQNFAAGTPSNININTGSSSSNRLTIRNFVKNEIATSDTNTVVHLQGAGVLQLGSASLGTGTTALQYTGTWSLEMGTTGVFSIGPVVGNSALEILNAPGYNPDVAANNPQLKETRSVTVVSGTLAVGADEKNPASAASNTTTGVFRSPVTLSGGNIASTGRKYLVSGGQTTSTSPTPVTAKFGANMTLTDNTTSKVLLYEPVPFGNPTGIALVANPSGPRSVRIVTDTAPTPLSSNFTWGNNSTLIADSGVESGGALRFERTAGTVTVGTGATLQVNAGGTVLLQGTVDALSDGAHHVNLVNNSSGTVAFPFGFDVVAAAGTKNVGNVSGTGSLAVEGGGSARLIANHIRQSSVTIGGDVQIRNAGAHGPPSGTSNIGSVSILAGAHFDLTTNKLITNTSAGTATAGTYNGLQGDVQRAYDFGAWDQPGLTTSMPDAVAGLTTIGVATGEQVRGLGPSDTDIFAGQTITGASTIAMYTYAGDANLDGTIDGGDYGIIDNFVQIPGASGYANGDFNYDGVIDGGDYGIIDNNIQAQGAPFSTSGDSVASVSAGVTAVPEPAGMVLLVAPFGYLLRRHRRQAS